MRDITNQKTIRKVLLEAVPKNEWHHITEVYRFFYEHYRDDLKPDDFLPLADYNGQEQWKRNIRVALRQFKLKDLILWNGKAKYLFPDNERIETIIIDRTEKKLSEEEIWTQLEKKRLIGLEGERFVVEYEKDRLLELGLADLATKVKRISDESAIRGFDILSYTKDGREKFIEVKTTITSKYSFEISFNERTKAMQLGDNYFLYFLRNFNPKNVNNEIKIYTLEELENEFEFVPNNFIAKKKIK